MPRYLVTGGAGFIGSHIAQALLSRGEAVRILDNLSTGHRRNIAQLTGDVDFLEGDLLDGQVLSRAVEGVEVIFHQAALASVPRSIAAPLETHEACVTGTLQLLNQARDAGVRRLVYAASSSAYGSRDQSSRMETDLPAPLSPYAVAKLAAEYYCQAFYTTYGLETVCLRYFNVFGPRQDLDSPYSAVIPLFIRAMLRGEQPVIFGDGHQTRDFTFVENVVQGNLLAADAVGAAGRVINIANHHQTSLLELIALLNEVLQLDIEPQHKPERVGDVRHSLANIDLARELLGYQPAVTLQEGLRESIDYYRTLVDR